LKGLSRESQSLSRLLKNPSQKGKRGKLIILQQKKQTMVLQMLKLKRKNMKVILFLLFSQEEILLQI